MQIGLVIDIILLIVAILLYLLLRGFIKYPNPQVQERADAMLAKNGFFLRLVAILFIAVLVFNIYSRLNGGLS